MKYFLHDSNAFNDEKVTQLFIKFGYEGVGLFYTILEKLAQQEKPILTDVLKHQLKVGKKLDKCWKFMESIELISSNNGETFNEQLLNFSKKYQVKKEKNAERIKQWRENQKDTKNVTRYESVSNTSKVNKTKLKLSKYKTTLLSDLKKSDVDNVEYFEITISFYELFKHNLTSSGISTARIEKSKGVWIDSIRLLIENDKFTKDDLREVFEFLKINDFWKKNILSTSTLREKFERLLFESRSKTKSKDIKDQEWLNYKQSIINNLNATK